jgi:elongation factor G
MASPARVFLTRPTAAADSSEEVIMNVPLTESIRNVAVVSHAGSGKTSLVEALAYCAGSLPAPGSVSAGTTVSDFEPEEIHHRTSLNTAVLRCSYQNRVLNLLDTPGSPSFIGETRSALRAVDGVIVVVSAASGVRSALQRLWSMIRDSGLPCVVFVNDLDKDGTAFENTVEALTKELEMTAVPLILPMGNGAQLGDIVDLLQNRVVTSRSDRPQSQQAPVPPEWRDRVDQARRRVMELVAEGDEALLERYLTDGVLTDEALLEGLQAGVQRASLVPIVGGSALRHIGVHSLLQTLVDLLPSPAGRAHVAPLQGVGLMEGGDRSPGTRCRPIHSPPSSSRPSSIHSSAVFLTCACIREPWKRIPPCITPRGRSGSEAGICSPFSAKNTRRSRVRRPERSWRSAS